MKLLVGFRLVLSSILVSLLLVTSVSFGAESSCYIPEKKGMRVQLSATVDVAKLRSLNYISNMKLAGNPAYMYEVAVVSSTKSAEFILASEFVTADKNELNFEIDELRMQKRVDSSSAYYSKLESLSQPTENVKIVLKRYHFVSGTDRELIYKENGTRVVNENYVPDESFDLLTLTNSQPGRGGQVVPTFLNLADQAVSVSSVSMPHELVTREARRPESCNCASDGICEGSTVYYRKRLEDANNNTRLLYNNYEKRVGLKTTSISEYIVREVIDNNNVMVSSVNAVFPNYKMRVEDLISFVPESDEKKVAYVPFKEDSDLTYLSSFLVNHDQHETPQFEIIGKSASGEIGLKSEEGYVLYSPGEHNLIQEDKDKCLTVDTKEYCSGTKLFAGQSFELEVVGINTSHSFQKLNSGYPVVLLRSKLSKRSTLIKSRVLQQDKVGVIEVGQRLQSADDEKYFKVLSTNGTDNFVLVGEETGEVEIVPISSKDFVATDLCMNLGGNEQCLGDEFEIGVDDLNLEFSGVLLNGDYIISFVDPTKKAVYPQTEVKSSLILDGSFKFDSNLCLGSYCNSETVITTQGNGKLYRTKILGVSSDNGSYVTFAHNSSLAGNRYVLSTSNGGNIRGTTNTCSEADCPGKVLYKDGSFEVKIAARNAEKTNYVFDYGLGQLSEISEAIKFSGCKDNLCLPQQVDLISAEHRRSQVLGFTENGVVLLTSLDRTQNAQVVVEPNLASIALRDGQCLQTQTDVCVGKEVNEAEGQTVVYEQVYANGKIIAIIDGARVELTTGVLYKGCDGFVCIGTPVYVVDSLGTDTNIGKPTRKGTVAGGDGRNYNVVFQADGGTTQVQSVDYRLMMKASGCTGDICAGSIIGEKTETPITVMAVGAEGTGSYVLRDSKETAFYGPGISIGDCVEVTKESTETYDIQPKTFCSNDRVYNAKKDYRRNGLGLAHVVGFYGGEGESRDDNDVKMLVVYARGEASKGQMGIVSKPIGHLMKNSGQVIDSVSSREIKAGQIIYQDAQMEIEFFGTDTYKGKPIFGILTKNELELFNNTLSVSPDACVDEDKKLCAGKEVKVLYRKSTGMNFGRIIAVEVLESGEKKMIVYVYSGEKQGTMTEADISDVEPLNSKCQIDVSGTCAEGDDQAVSDQFLPDLLAE